MTATSKEKIRFPYPDEVPTPKGAEGWEEMYPYYYLFSKERGDYERFWFWDRMHFPLPIPPFEMTVVQEAWNIAFSYYFSRAWVLPTTRGLSQRILNGYLYISPIEIKDPKEIEERMKLFKERVGYSFKEWNRLYSEWLEKVKSLIKEVDSIEFKPLPEIDTEDYYISKLYGYGMQLILNFEKLIQMWIISWYYHFSYFTSYGVQLTLFETLKKLFPGITEQTITKLVTGVELDLYKPDEKLKELAKLAVRLGVTDPIKRLFSEPDKLFEELKKSDEGRRWLEEFEASKDPYFYVSTQVYPNMYNPTIGPIWIDRLDIPLLHIKDYIEKLERGESIERPLEELKREKERIYNEYYSLLKTDDERKAFKDIVELARLTYPYLENHPWWIDNVTWSKMWRKAMELGELLVHYGVIDEPGDIFFMKVSEVREVLADLVKSWADNIKPAAPLHWPKIIKRRKEIWNVLRRNPPPPALGVPPEVITEPITLMLYGITTERIKEWLGVIAIKPEEMVELKGHPGSPGIARGIARVVRDVEELGKVQPGEILVCPCTSPMWCPIFPKIKAIVTDIGGMMSHAAIVGREYGIPAVVGTGVATSVIKTGDTIEVNGTDGIVKIIKRAS